MNWIRWAIVEVRDGDEMNHKTLKKFAFNARRELLQKIKKKMDHIGLTDKALIEKVAYTWFIRIILLRFMEINGYLSEQVFHSSYKTEDAFKDRIIRHCSQLHNYFPAVFSSNYKYIEILFPERMLDKQSFITKLTDPTVIPIEKWKQVEIIGWLYQYYFSEEKDRVIKAKKKYKAEEIPYATQLFTPDWIVRYMVQNTLGRYWVESHPEHRDLLVNWEYYIDNPNQEHNLIEKLQPFTNNSLKVEEIKCFDPAVGCGHILVYMFDVLYEIYQRCGYDVKGIPRLIIENNLFGADIDDRVHHLACFSIIMKAMQYNKDFLSSMAQDGLKINIVSVQETNSLTDEDIAYFAGQDEGMIYTKIKLFINQFVSAKTYGSLVHIDSNEVELIKEKYNELRAKQTSTVHEVQSKKKLLELMPLLLKQAEILMPQYDILITNPPYIGNRYLNSVLAKHVDMHYSIGKKDLFAAFMLYGLKKVKKCGHLGFMTPYVWMFISSFEQLRAHIIHDKDISSLILLEYSGFDGATVPVCTFALRNYRAGISGEYISLANFKGVNNQPIKALEAVKNPDLKYRYSVPTSSFKKIPGQPLSFWAGKNAIKAIESSEKLESIAKPRVGLQTSDNQRFLRLWHEVDYCRIGFGMNDRNEAQQSKLKWFPYNKGGEFRKWYGNQFYVVNWQEDGREIREFNAYLNASRDSKIGIANTEFYFKESITWSFVSSSHFGVRYSEKGFIFDTGGSSVFVDSDLLYYLTAFLCSKPAFEFLRIQNPTLNFQPGNIANLPLIIPGGRDMIAWIIELAKENVAISKREWDSFETSWNFSVHPLLKFKGEEKTLNQAFANWKRYALQQFQMMKNNEETLNSIFIDIYRLGEEYTPDVNYESVTIRTANKEREIKSLISYAVGCMFGRYSLDEEGLVFAGGDFDEQRYRSFPTATNNIIPISSEGYFENDVVSRFIEFLKVAFGEETLVINLEFIADALGRKKEETAKDTLYRYFLQDFYKDHLQFYRKRPIYWLFQSGKKRACNCLVYIHRYNPYTLSHMHNKYLKNVLAQVEAARESLVLRGNTGKVKTSQYKNELLTLEKQLEELKNYDKLLQKMADQRIEINLDDGIAVNYEKFHDLLATIK